MGTTFKYVADEALEAHKHLDLPCPLCNREGNVYYIYATVDIPGEGEGLISEACVDCIKAMKLDEISSWDTEKRIADYLRLSLQPLSKPERRERQAAICNELRRTPRLPHFVQGDDWPFCCNDLTEYTGEPSTAQAELLDKEGQYWRRGPATHHEHTRTLVPSKKMAVLGGVSAFRCLTCGKLYWTFQCT